uniref:F-box domain-containing protein n=1 Tax=Anopheles atroparvus TaxID=41427 RepID=A0AAG5D1U0_ANOAO
MCVETGSLISRTMLCDLDEYSLGHVFMFLSVSDLDNCTLVCRKFKCIIQQYVYPKKCMHSLVAGALKGVNLSPYFFTSRKRVKLDENWRNGRYEERTFFQHNVMYISQMVIDKEWLYITHGGRLQAHRRTKDQYLIDTKKCWMIGTARESDITSLVKENCSFFAGRMDGKVMIYDLDTQERVLQSISDDVIKAVDVHRDVYAVTTKNQSTYVLSRSQEELDYLDDGESPLLQLNYAFPEAYETIKLKSNRIAAGKFHCNKKTALHLIDLCSCKVFKLNSKTMAVYDVLWKDDSCIISGNFDTTLRLVDTRTGNDEAYWTDPYNASIYCLSYNGSYAVHCGMKYHYRTNLYDLRVPNRCIQMYFPAKKNNNYSPVYNIATDCSLLFLVTDHNLRILNFDADWAASKDYAAI